MATHTTVLSLRLPGHEKAGLERLARRRGRAVGEVAARMVIEGRRREEFAWIDFRDTPAGRMACLQGTRLQVWWLTRLARHFKNDAGKVAKHLDLPVAQVRAALNYSEAFPEEMEIAIRDHEETTLEDLKRQLPGLEIFDAPARKPSRRGRK